MGRPTKIVKVRHILREIMRIASPKTDPRKVSPEEFSRVLTGSEFGCREIQS